MKKHTFSMLTVSALLLALGSVGMAQQDADPKAFAVIVHPSNTVASLTRAEVSDFLLKKTTRWPDGSATEPVDQASSSSLREAFSVVVHERTVDRVKNYWQRKIFSGRDVPPPELDNDREVIAFVASEEGAIGYVQADAELTGVKAISLSD